MECCARRRSRTPPNGRADSSAQVGARADSSTHYDVPVPVMALPIKFKGGYPVGTCLAAPSAPSWSPGGTHLWQRSPLSGLMRRWFTSPTGNRPHWFAADFLQRFGREDSDAWRETPPVIMVVDRAGRVVQGGR